MPDRAKVTSLEAIDNFRAKLVIYRDKAGRTHAIRVGDLVRPEIFRKRVLKTAQIVLSDKAPKLDCAVRNLSDTGACLQVSTTFGIPSNFEVVIEGVRRACRSIWRTDTKIGVTFQ